MLKTYAPAILLIPLLLDDSLPGFTLPIMLTMFLGFSVRLGLNWKDNTITFKDSIIRIVCGISFTYIAMFVWKDFEVKHNIIYTVFAISFVSLELAVQGSNLIQMGIRGWAQKWINYLLAKNDSI